MKRLDAMERLLLGRRLAERPAGQFYEGDDARGVLVTCPPLPSGRAFAQIVDERTKRLVLVPATIETAGWKAGRSRSPSTTTSRRRCARHGV